MSNHQAGRGAVPAGARAGAAPEWLVALFASLDAKDIDGWLAHLSDDVRFRYGSGPVLQGKPAVREMVDVFLAGLRGLRHALLQCWESGDRLICQGEVTYTRRDGTDLTLPFTNIFGIQSGRVHEYLIYLDPTPL